MKVEMPRIAEDAAILKYLLGFIWLCLLLFVGEPDLLDTIIDILRHLYLKG